MRPLLSIFLILTSCAHTFRESETEKAARIERARISDELVTREYEARLAENARAAAARAETEKFGTPLKQFAESHGQPTETEMHEGATVFWYRDTDPPMYYVFKNDKLVSKTIDKETMRYKDDRELKRAELRQQDEANKDQQRTNRFMIWQSMQNNRPKPNRQVTEPYMMPVRKTTNCTSRAIGGGTVTTSCD